MRPIAEAQCSLVMESENSPFADCIAEMRSDAAGALMIECTNKMCQDSAAICAFIELMGEACSGINMDPPTSINLIKHQHGCPPPPCGEHMVYEFNRSPCESSCAEPNGPEACILIVVEGCFCETGYSKKNGECVLPSDCGCKMDNQDFMIGDVYMKYGCGESCTCDPSNTGAMTCEAYSCTANAACENRDGTNACYCAGVYEPSDSSTGTGTDPTTGDMKNPEDCIDPCATLDCALHQMCVSGNCVEVCESNRFDAAGNCIDVGKCKEDYNCGDNAECGDDGLCECLSGYMGNGYSGCIVDPECGPDMRPDAEDKCAAIMSDAGSPFADCIAALSSTTAGTDTLDMFMEVCISDICRSQATICIYIDMMRMECETIGHSPPDSINFIKVDHGCPPPPCGDNMTYEFSMSPCEVSCAEPNVPATCTEDLIEGCFCNEGYARKGYDCVLPENCGCVMDNMAFAIGDVYMKDGCGEECTCEPSNMGAMTCEAYSCTANAACKNRDGTNACYCTAGHEPSDTSTGTGTDPTTGDMMNPEDCIACESGNFDADNNCVDVGKCTEYKHCATHAECEENNVCVCLPGYIGIGYIQCTVHPECGPDMRPAAEAECNSLMTSSSSPNADCIAEMQSVPASNAMLNTWQEECIMSVCQGENAICIYIDLMGIECTKINKSPPAPDTVNFIKLQFNCPPPPCGENMKYDFLRSPCEPSCAELNGPEMCTQGMVEGCFCEEGFVRKVDLCVLPEECGCTMDNMDFEIGDVYMTGGCGEVCTCEPSNTGAMTCVTHSCTASAVCETRGVTNTCYCAEGYEPSGSSTGTGTDPTPGDMMNPEDCVDTDECEDPATCAEHQICTNMEPFYTCVCEEGYRMGDGEVCDNINECIDGTDDCDANSDCKDDPGTFHCVCKLGFAMDPITNKCEDVEECATNRHDCDKPTTICLNEPGTFECFCKPGYEIMDRRECKDINECDTNTDDCVENAICKNTVPGFSCSCEAGYMESSGACVDVNECENTPPCTSTEDCENNDGSYTCECKDGYMSNGNGNCIDVNECENTPPCTSMENCENKAGSYTCNCKDGYMSDGNGNCTDVDECTVVPFICGTNSVCQDLEGSYICNCENGYESQSMDGANCVDINECNTGIVCTYDKICENALGTFNCVCGRSMELSAEKVCEPIDPCDPDPCGENSDCMLTGTEYTCNCIRGYMHNAERVCEDPCMLCLDGKICIGSECIDDPGQTQHPCENCVDPTNCQVTGSTVSCSCPAGMTGDGKQPPAGTGCGEDINECDEGTDTCSADRNCQNTVGSYTCVCPPNTVDLVTECFDLGCARDPTMCGENKSCKQGTGGMYACACVSGYRMVNDVCEEINECVENTPCGVNKKCNNLPGTYECVCLEGYEMGPTQQCSDINECTEGYDNCVDVARCENTVPSFRCTCEEGLEMFELPTGKITCINVDECAMGTATCVPHSVCVDAEEGYSCECEEGWKKIGNNCENVNECLGLHDCSPNAECLDNEGSYSCDCYEGFSGPGTFCDDVNECTLPANNCGPNTDCVNFPGGFLCLCKAGFSGHCDACEDVDECLTGTDDCDTSAECQNTPGSFLCSCGEGLLIQNGICEDVDECWLGTLVCPNTATCVNTHGSYWCRCNAGYFPDQSGGCQDIDECAQQYPCSSKAACANFDGYSTCTCFPGYSGNGLECQFVFALEKCGTDYCDRNAICMNAECTCALGYQGTGILSETNPGCVDKNECRLGTAFCADGALCTNVAGSYSCSCPVGQYGDGFTCQELDICGTPGRCEPTADCVPMEAFTGALFMCMCHDGYQKNALDICEYINECTENAASPCEANALCINMEPGYTCECEPGYSRNPTTNSCDDIDECGANLHDCDLGHDVSPHGTCENTDGGYDCICLDAYELVDGKCSEKGKPNCNLVCGAHQYCAFTSIGTYQFETCTCMEGYVQVNRQECSAVDNCKTIVCGSNAQCMFDSELGSRCECFSGFTGNGKLCQDINECAAVPSVCAFDAVCSNKMGSHVCTCKVGYEGDGLQACTPIPASEDICGCGSNGLCIGIICVCDDRYRVDYSKTADKCILEDINNCHMYAQCVYAEGSSTCDCQCKDGFIGDGVTTCDVDECQAGNAACSPFSNCINEHPGYSCQCLPGYTGSGFTCTQGTAGSCPNGCSVNSVCVDGTCKCMPGYQGNGESCSNINECIAGPCSSDATCNDYNGGCTCACNSGFKGDGHKCEDVNECLRDRHDCSQYAQCDNTHGSFTCTCLLGFAGSGTVCDADPTCGGQCSLAASCVEQVSVYECKCNDGYSGNGVSCQDFDECATTADNGCDSNAICTNTDGSYSCVCRGGFRGTGYFCSDINECASSALKVCPSNSYCHNVVGDYDCECDHGYELIDGTCMDIDECLGNHGCVANEYCHNTVGSYECRCVEGYRATTGGCININECMKTENLCQAIATCNDLTPGYQCLCSAGYIQSADKKTCSPVDECESGTHDCSLRAYCIDDVNGFICICKEGFSGDGKTCTNIDECNDGSNRCPGRTCIDLIGSYQCQCDEGFEFENGQCTNIDECTLPAGSQMAARCVNAICMDASPGYNCVCLAGFEEVEGFCVDDDECLENPCVTHATCTNTAGSFSCECDYGYEAIGLGICVDRDECFLSPSICGNPAVSTCTNVDGSYSCGCMSGFSNDDGYCADVDECAGDPGCGLNEHCTNTIASFRCDCNTGFQRGANGCENVNECRLDHNNCHAFADCLDNEGSYSCQCKTGYTGSGVFCGTICDDSKCASMETCVVKNGAAVCECRCQGDGCSMPGEVCGSNGQMYSNEARLQIVSCQAGATVEVAYRGMCQASCDNIVCPMYQLCGPNAGGHLHCSCPDCTPEEENSGLVCGSDQLTYTSACQLYEMRCQYSVELDVAHDDQCQTRRDCFLSDWTDFTDCSAICGEGSQTRTRTVVRYPEFGGKRCESRVETTACFLAECPGSPCMRYVCDHPAAECTVGSDMQPECFCPDCTGASEDPVCGIVDTTYSTYKGECLLRLAACSTDKPFALLSNAPCADGLPNEPVDCGVLPHMEAYTNAAGCVSKDMVNIGRCAGGCGQVTGHCCDPSACSMEQVTLYCPDGTEVTEAIPVITQCACREDARSASMQGGVEYCPAQ